MKENVLVDIKINYDWKVGRIKRLFGDSAEVVLDDLETYNKKVDIKMLSKLRSNSSLSALRDFSSQFSLSRLDLLEKSLAGPYSQLCSQPPGDFCQLFKGSLPVFLYSLVKSELTELLAFKDRLFALFFRVLDLSVKFLQSYSATLAFDVKHDLVFSTWPEVLEATEILLGKEDFIKNLYEICQYVPDNFIIEAHSDKVSPFQAVFVDYFVQSKGLESLIQIFDSIREIDLNAGLVFSIDLQFLDQILRKDVVRAFCVRVFGKFIKIAEGFEESCLKAEDYLKIFRTFVVLIENLEEYGKAVEVSYMEILTRAVFSGSLEKRIRGVVELSELIERKTRFVNDFDLAEFVLARGIADDILQKRTHSQILVKADKVLGFLARLGKLDERMLALIQSFETSMEKQVSENFSSIYKAIYPYLNTAQKKMFKGSFEFFREEEQGKVFDKDLFRECFAGCKDYLGVMKGIRIIADMIIADKQLKETFFALYKEGLNDAQFSFHYIKIMCLILKAAETAELNKVHQDLSLYSSTVEALSSCLKLSPSGKPSTNKIPNQKNLQLRFSLLALLSKRSTFRLSREATTRLFRLFLSSEEPNFRGRLQKYLKTYPDNYKAEVLLPLFADPLFESTFSVESFKVFKNIFFQVNSNKSLLIEKGKFQYVLQAPVTSLGTLFRLLYVSKKSVLGKIKILIRNLLSCYSFEIIESSYEIFTRHLDLLRSLHNKGDPEDVYKYVNIVHDLYLGLVETRSGPVVKAVLVLPGGKEYYSVSETADVFSIRKYICTRLGNDLAEVAFAFKGRVYDCLDNSALLKLAKDDEVLFLHQQKFFEISGRIYLNEFLKADLEDYWKLAVSDERYAAMAFAIAKALGCSEALKAKVAGLEVLESDLSPETPAYSLQVLHLLYLSLSSEAFIESAKASKSLKSILRGMSSILSSGKCQVDLLVYCLQFTRYTLSKDNTDSDSVLSIFFNSFIWLLSNLKSSRFTEVYQMFCGNYSVISKVLDDQAFRAKCRQVIAANCLVIINKFNEIDQENIEINEFQDYIRYFLYLSEQTENFINLILTHSLELLQQAKFAGVLIVVSAVLDKSTDESALNGIVNHILLKTLLCIKEPLSKEHKNLSFMLKLLTKHARLVKEINFPLFCLEFLFRLPDSNLFPRCKSNSTRVECFNFITKFIELHPRLQPNLIQEVESLIRVKSWRTLRPKDWKISIQNTKRQEKNLVGIKNPNSICYSNSLIQQIFHINAFTEFILFGVKAGDCPVADCLKSMFAKMKFGYSQVISGKKIVREVNQSDILNEQKDAEEFLNSLFVKLMNSKSEQVCQLINHFFSFVQIQEIKSQDCPHSQIKEESFTSLNIELNSDSLLSSLEKSFKAETLEHENAYECVHCNKKVKATRKQSFLNLPNYLILVLKRFSYDAGSGMRKKINDRFAFDEKLDLSTFLHENLPGASQNSTFCLKGITLHVGNTDQGHYFSYIKTEGGLWVEFNDAEVDYVKKDSVFAKAFGDKNDSSLPSAYLLVYEKEKIDLGRFLDQGVKGETSKMAQFEGVHRKNQELMIREIVFSDNFLEFFEKMIEFPAAGVFCVEYFFACFIRMSLNGKYVFKICKKLFDHLQVGAVEHLLMMISDVCGCFELLFFNSNSESVNLISLLIRKFLNELSPDFVFVSASKLISSLNSLHKSKTNAPERFYEILGLLLRPLEDFCKKERIVEFYMQTLCKSYPVVEMIDGSSDLRFISREHYSNVSSSLKPGPWKMTFLLSFFADNLHLLSEGEKETLCGDKYMFYFFQEISSKEEILALSQMYSNLFEQDVDGAYNYMIQLLQCSFERSIKYLRLMSVFIRRYSKRLQILQLFLEDYLDLVNPELNDWSCEMVRYLVKFFQKTSLEELSQYLSQSKVQFFDQLVLSYLQVSQSSYKANKTKRLYEIFSSNQDIQLQDSDDEIEPKHLQVQKPIFVCSQSSSVKTTVVGSLENEIVLLQPDDNKAPKLFDKSKFASLQVSFHDN